MLELSRGRFRILTELISLSQKREINTEYIIKQLTSGEGVIGVMPWRSATLDAVFISADSFAPYSVRLYTGKDRHSHFLEVVGVFSWIRYLFMMILLVTIHAVWPILCLIVIHVSGIANAFAKSGNISPEVSDIINSLSAIVINHKDVIFGAVLILTSISLAATVCKGLWSIISMKARTESVAEKISLRLSDLDYRKL